MVICGLHTNFSVRYWVSYTLYISFTGSVIPFMKWNELPRVTWPVSNTPTPPPRPFLQWALYPQIGSVIPFMKWNELPRVTWPVSNTVPPPPLPPMSPLSSNWFKNKPLSGLLARLQCITWYENCLPSTGFFRASWKISTLTTWFPSVRNNCYIWNSLLRETSSKSILLSRKRFSALDHMI